MLNRPVQNEHISAWSLARQINSVKGKAALGNSNEQLNTECSLFSVDKLSNQAHDGSAIKEYY